MTTANGRIVQRGLGLCAVLALTTVVWAQSYQVNISGATLFNNFFGSPQSTNDYINVDGDFRQFGSNCDLLPFSGFHVNPCDGVSFVDQLAPAFASCAAPNPIDNPTRWVVNYRGVGSGNGLAELRDYALCGYLYTNTPDPGRINSVIYWNASGDQLPTCGQGPDGTPTGYARTSVDVAVMDVPLSHFVRVPGTPAWNLKPGVLGYGMNPLLSYTCCTPSGSTNMLETLTSSICGGQTLPASSTHSVSAAWVPMAVLVNIGAVQSAGCDGLQQNISISELRYLYLAGRMPSGENLVAATREAASGTRNGFCNTIGIDPSFGRGDNCGGILTALGSNAFVGPRFRANNNMSTGQLVSVVKNCRLAIGYAGADSAKTALIAGQEEVLGVIFDDRGGTLPVRPSASTVLHACNPNTGYQIGGNETFITVGDPFAAYPGRVPPLAAYPGHESNPPMANAEAAAYIRNITESAAQPPSDPNQGLMPGQLLARSFFLPRAFDCIQDPDNPTQWITNPSLDLTLQTYIQNNNTSINVRAFGDPNYPADLTPKRAGTSDYPIVWNDPNEVCNHTTCDCEYPPNGQYSDGSTNGAYRNPYTGTYGDALGAYGLAGGNKLNPRNRLMGDFNGDGCRDINDIPAMMAAIYDTMVLHNPAYPTYRPLANANANDPAVPEIIGDFNADGNFDCRDVRYFCDGLALDPSDGQLHRAAAFLAVDNAWSNLTGNDNFFNTTIYDVNGNIRPWVRGASAADVAGNDCVAPGAKPCGYDCQADCTDAHYIDANFGDWRILDEAVAMDLSCDLTNDRQVDLADLQKVESLMGSACPGLTHGACVGDLNCDGVVSFKDINPFVMYLSNFSAWQSTYASCDPRNGDVNGDGTYPLFKDINPFVSLLSSAPLPISCP